MLGTSECQYGEEGPSEDKSSLGGSKAERWKEEKAGREEEVERQHWLHWPEL